LPLNETALLVSFGNCIDESINDKVIALHHAFTKTPFAGFIETVPAFSSLAVFYNLPVVRKNIAQGKTAFEFVKNITEKLIANPDTSTVLQTETINKIPVYYNGEDLEALANMKSLKPEELIAIHCALVYRVYMIGFLPGFAYMGKLDGRIAAPRRLSPRILVPAGSVGIAGSQTGIYPFASPGGWQLIGQTPLKIFDSRKKTPCLFKAGDHVKFIAINKNEFDNLNEY
jgi:inhibitor of KinA